MSRSTLLGLMALIEGGAGLFMMLAPDLARSQLLGGALPGLTTSGLQIVGLCMLGLGLMCLAGLRRRALRFPFTVMLVYNALAAAGLAGVALLGAPMGPLLWPTVLLHGALAAVQLWSQRSA
ncbi:hypothetical protein [Tabrizicola sp. BL-A-41-H6]|uniref:hypothetical protein n=1 Tax=Tabrizicola sp. BL-A-41-H6 TaxID=3421107 RepID=UPI003D67601C